MNNIINFLLVFFLYLLFPLHSIAKNCEKPQMPSKDEWNKWIKSIKIEAFEYGISQLTIDKVLSDVSPQSKIIMRDRCQPESTITLKEYLYYRLDKSRVIAGKRMYSKYKKELDQVSNHFKVQPRFILSILGLESFYGKNQGKIKTIDAVTTLAFDRRRSSFYKKQLFATLKIIDNNFVDTENLKGSWGGALGMTQMLPTTFLESGYDYNQDGKVDIWNNYLDAFASIANYLSSIDKNPWKFDSTWGREVMPPKNISEFYDLLKQKNPIGCGAVKSRSISKKLDEWQKLGFRTIDGKDLPKRKDLNARLVSPDGIDGRMFLVYSNYKLFLYYNCSSYYAISVGLLSDEFDY